MRAAAFILACLARAGLGRRVQMPASQKAESHDVKALAGLFDSLAPAAGYQIPGAGLGMDRVVKTSRASDQAQMMARRRGGRSKFDPELYPGVQAPTGFWDPLGFTADGDEEAFLRRRAVEVKHGRVAMLASLGYALGGYDVTFPGNIAPGVSFKSINVDGPFSAWSKVPEEGKLQILISILIIEIYSEAQKPHYMRGGPVGQVPFFYGNGVFGAKDPDDLDRLRKAEMKHGRLAMFGIISFLINHNLPGAVPFLPSTF
mmetsp:Transcript_97441/g.179056  ORF Transcript_97441/g.179056 Transcript_97441/m.179056 type:complete len:259 (+) Transcript_97441:65-841(+)